MKKFLFLCALCVLCGDSAIFAAQIGGPVAIDPIPNKDEIQVVKPKEITGKEKQVQVKLPAKALTIVAVAAEAPALEAGVVITVVNRISKDGGKTWTDFGRFTCSPPPWLDKTKCEVVFFEAGPDGKPILLPDGTLMESDIETKDTAGTDKKGTVGLKYTVGKAP